MPSTFEAGNENKVHKKVKILGVGVSSTTEEKLLRDVRSWIEKKKKFYIVTPNPEIVMVARENPDLMSALNQSDIALSDGVGLVWAAKVLYNSDINLIKGRVVFINLLRLASKKGWRVYLLGGKGEEAKKAFEVLSHTFKNAQIRYDPGPKLNIRCEPASQIDQNIEHTVISAINTFKPHLLFVAFGAPKQEVWLKRHLGGLDIGGGMVVGGAFRYISGISKLPPQWIENLGVEWLWRLFTEPWRLKRILAATVLFPLAIYKEKYVG
ncbi:WecB/TagA/CpsF family glycosyltransferase [Candidatus Woesebacteria bacterium]|nr:WecB/TagA/CpsF family glycosyltransferase [Candidatus Woesebacteria bacterium]